MGTDITRKPFTIAIAGDLKYGRTVHSLVPLLTKYCDQVNFRFIAPDFLQLPKHIVDQAKNSGMSCELTDDFITVISDVNAIYMVRPQLERMADEAERDQWSEVEKRYRLGKKILDQHCRADVLITHPEPRNAELNTDLDDLPNAVYRRRQPENGVLVRMALSVFILGKVDKFV